MSLANQPLSNRRRPSPAILFAIFTLLGGVMFLCFFLPPVVHVIEARQWVATPCTIVSSTVGEHTGSKGGRTYSVDIIYTYEAEGRQRTSARYQFMGGSSSGYAGKAAIVNRYRRGRPAVCYVNPANPEDAVIERGFTPDMLLGLIPLLFMVIGVAGLIFTRKPRAPAGRATAWEPAAMRHAGDFGMVTAAPIEMKPVVTPLGKLGFAFFFTLFWNGLLSVFVYQAFEGWRTHHGSWILGFFLTPFVLVGLTMVVVSWWLFLALFNPRVHLRLTPGALRPGKDFSVEWKIPGGSARLAHLRILIECREEAVYSSGKESSTATAVCYRQALVDSEKCDELGRGTASGSVPANVMHSLDTGRNRIKWLIRVEGKVPRWPGIKDEYAVMMLPERWKEAV